MKSYKIESGIPTPVRKRRSRFGAISFSEMAIGESVLLDTCKKDCVKKYRAIYSSIYKLLRSENPEGKFRVGTIENKGKTEIRLWRTE